MYEVRRAPSTLLRGALGNKKSWRFWFGFCLLTRSILIFLSYASNEDTGYRWRVPLWSHAHIRWAEVDWLWRQFDEVITARRLKWVRKMEFLFRIEQEVQRGLLNDGCKKKNRNKRKWCAKTRPWGRDIYVLASISLDGFKLMYLKITVERSLSKNYLCFYCCRRHAPGGGTYTFLRASDWMDLNWYTLKL